MNKRPLSITVVSWIFIVAGVLGLAYHARDFDPERPFDSDFLWICVVRLLAIVCGVFMLRGRNWARWLLVVWLGYHAGLSVLHTPFEMVVHSLLLVGFLFLLFRRTASTYFGGPPTTMQISKSDEANVA